MKLSEFCVNHPAIVLILCIAAVLFGLLSVSSINREFIPNVVMPSAMVIGTYPGASAETIEKELTEVLEEGLSGLSNLKSLNSTSRNSVSYIDLEFTEKTDIDAMLPEIRAKVSMLDYPDGVRNEPQVIRMGSEFLPIFSFVVQGDLRKVELTRFTEESILPRLSRISGVSSAKAYGGQEEQLEIRIHTEEAAEKGIPVSQVYQLLQYNNAVFPVGNVDIRGRERALLVDGQFDTIDEIGQLVVGASDKAPVYLRDIADISMEKTSLDMRVFSGDNDYLVVDIAKRINGNTSFICKEAEKELDSIQEEFPGLVDFVILQNDSTMVDNSLMSVVRSALFGILMAVGVILIFLHDIRSTLVIGISIPFSILLSLIGMKLTGRTLNFLSLSGITVALGMVVDASIVILESIHQKMQSGMSVKDSCSIGATEVSGAIIASTSTSISVFAPLIALTGIIGIFMKDISLTLVFALLGSTVVAICVVPPLANFLLSCSRLTVQKKSVWDKLDIFGRFQRFYVRLLKASINNRWFMVLISIAVLIVTALLITSLGMSFLPATDTGDFYIFLTTPDWASYDYTYNVMRQVGDMVSRLVPEVENAVYFSGFSGENSRTNGVANRAYAKIILAEKQDRDRSVHEIIKMLQSELGSTIQDAEILVQNGGLDKLMGLATGGSGFQVEVSSVSLEDLQAASEQIQGFLKKQSTIYKTDVTMKLGAEEVVIDTLFQTIGSFGISPYELGLRTRILYHGMEAGKFRSGSVNYPIILTSDLADRALNPGEIDHTKTISSGGEAVHITSFSRIDVQQSLSYINRKDRIRSVTVTGYSYEKDLTALRGNFEQYLQENSLPPGVSWNLGGETGLLDTSLIQLLAVIAVAVFLVYAVMVIQFEKFAQPLIIMVSVPFSIIGIILGLLLFGSDLTMIAFLGIIALAGIVVNNAIVLIDYINLIRKQSDMSLREAVIHGASMRLRPVIMTTLTTMLGILPLAFAAGNGAEIYAPLGQAIAGGLLSSTLITLFLVPTIYFSLEKRH